MELLDGHFMLDIDLSILATGRENYIEYTKQIRTEYAVYPDEVYNPGRVKVLQHFVGMDRIYKTDHFSSLWEERAKQNLEFELGTLLD